MKEKLESSPLYSANAPFVEGLYEDYLNDPESVSVAWREYFAQLRGATPAQGERRRSEVREAFARRARRAQPRGEPISAPLSSSDADKQVGILKLIQAYRRFGHMAAVLDPLAFRPKPDTRVLELETHGLSEADLDATFHSGTLAAPRASTLRHVLSVLRESYAGHIGVEYTHINNIDQRIWIQEHMEESRAQPNLDPALRRQILQRIIAAEGLERYLHTRYAGQKRFSLEGGEALIPVLDELIEAAGGYGVKEIALGMAHRGRLNVLINIMGKDPSELFMMFEGRYQGADKVSGDVKYHEGFSSNVATSGGPVHLALAFNPSHLEIIGPVVEGSVRARQDRRKDERRRQVIPILIHGDAALAGQGVVYETINLSQTRGFTTGGTLHVVVNNQIGFTTSHPLDTRSTLYCTEIGKVVQAPIFHVNGDDPDAVIFAARLALEFRMTFNRDVFMDLICYRRHGHNEADEPAVTQPMMYTVIRSHPTLPEIYGRRLIEDGVVQPGEPEAMAQAYRADLEAGRRVSPHYDPDFAYPYVSNWTPYLDGRWTDPADTTVPLETVRRLGEQINTVPEDFQLHPRVERIIEDRRKMIAGSLPIDWGCAETLAYATLLDEGYEVRLTGQDSGRGTFFHRHAVLHHQLTGRVLRPAATGEGRSVAVHGGGLHPFRGGRPRLRVRLRYHRARHPRRLGSAVRGLRQRGPGGDRPVHQPPRNRSGGASAGSSSCSPTGGRARARNTPPRAWSASCTSAPRRTSRSATPRPPPRCSTSCAAS